MARLSRGCPILANAWTKAARDRYDCSPDLHSARLTGHACGPLVLRPQRQHDSLAANFFSHDWDGTDCRPWTPSFVCFLTAVPAAVRPRIPPKPRTVRTAEITAVIAGSVEIIPRHGRPVEGAAVAITASTTSTGICLRAEKCCSNSEGQHCDNPSNHKELATLNVCTAYLGMSQARVAIDLNG